MGVHKHNGTMDGAVTPICNDCGVSLCWDISIEQYREDREFWDAWICRDCNDGEPMNRVLFSRLSMGSYRNSQ